MKRFRYGVAICAGTLLLSAPGALRAQRSDSYTWKLGLEAGVAAFQTRSQDTKFLPSAGAHLMIMARRGGLIFGVDEAIGTDEQSNQILFNDIRRYQATLVAFPSQLPLEPYFGVGAGIIQVVNPRVVSDVTDPTDRAFLLADAKDHSASGYLGALFGIQGRWGRVSAFGQLQAGTSPGDDKLLKGGFYTIHGGIRIGLGSAREGVSAGGY